MSTTLQTNGTNHLIDVRQILPRFRHSTIFQKWNEMPAGDTIILVNDHDPVPLYYQFAAEYKNQYEWDYLEKGPDVWSVRITKTGGAPSSPPPKDDKPFTITQDAVTLDVRPIFQSGGSPCGIIDEAVSHVKPHQVFRLIAPFEPLPLIAKLGRAGFTHASKQQDDGSWKLEFHKEQAHGCCCEKKKAQEDEKASGNDVVLDARGLEPPEPLVRTLEALTNLKKGNTLTMHSSRKPMHLFEELGRRSFSYDCSEQADHTFLTRIWHSD
jgi:uncharacterized protein (DUF2249 family)